MQDNATDTITVTGVNIDGFASQIESGTKSSVDDIIVGQGGDILIEAKELNIKEGGNISVSSTAQKILKVVKAAILPLILQIQ